MATSQKKQSTKESKRKKSLLIDETEEIENAEKGRKAELGCSLTEGDQPGNRKGGNNTHTGLVHI
jgi:hypothetical protein